MSTDTEKAIKACKAKLADAQSARNAAAAAVEAHNLVVRTAHADLHAAELAHAMTMPQCDYVVSSRSRPTKVERAAIMRRTEKQVVVNVFGGAGERTFRVDRWGKLSPYPRRRSYNTETVTLENLPALPKKATP